MPSGPRRRPRCGASTSRSGGRARGPAGAAGGLLNEIKLGRPVGGEDVLGLRTALKAGVLALPEDRRARLQELSGRAVRKSLLLP